MVYGHLCHIRVKVSVSLSRGVHQVYNGFSEYLSQFKRGNKFASFAYLITSQSQRHTPLLFRLLRLLCLPRLLTGT